MTGDPYYGLEMSLEMAHKVIVPQKKIMSRSFLNSGTLIVNRALQCMSPRRTWDSPTPPTQASKKGQILIKKVFTFLHIFTVLYGYFLSPCMQDALYSTCYKKYVGPGNPVLLVVTQMLSTTDSK